MRVHYQTTKVPRNKYKSLYFFTECFSVHLFNNFLNVSLTPKLNVDHIN